MNLLLANDVVPDQGTGYVFAAYLFFMLIILIYIGILGLKFNRINKELGQLNDELEGKAAPPVAPTPATAPVETGQPVEKVEANG